MFFFEILLSFLIIALPILISIAFLTLAERKVMGSIQQRYGPNFVGFWGLLQPMADGLKLLLKESIIPTNANTFSFILAPILTFFFSLVSWSFVPFSSMSFLANVDICILLFFAISSLGVYGIILSGWSSNSKYAFFGALRSCAQMISYEIVMGINVISSLLAVGSLNYLDIVNYQKFVYFCIPLSALCIMFLISILAETNRSPFDLPEAESELVSGFNVEYSSMGFALFFLAEYGSIILISLFTVLIYFGGWLSFEIFNFLFIDCFVLGFKTSIILFFFIIVRASFPRYRIDQLMRLCWKIFLPLAFGILLLILCLLFCSNGIY